MKIETKFNFTQLAEKWVSVTVLMGCVLIAVGLVYMTVTAGDIGNNLAKKRVNLDEFNP